ncbi:hypothetical protein ACFSHQ_10145 [Gemmobacter lanyuensis]
MSHLFRRFRLHFLALLLPLLTLLASPAQARCTGQNLLDALSPDESARLTAATDRQPFARGNLWQATRGTDRLTLLGTYHLSDHRHDRMISTLTPSSPAPPSFWSRPARKRKRPFAATSPKTPASSSSPKGQA